MATREIPKSSSYPGNSYKQRDQQQSKSVQQEKTDIPYKPKQIAKARTRKKSLFKKFIGYLVEDQIENARERTLIEIIRPGLKNLIYDAATGMLDGILYGEDSRRTSGNNIRAYSGGRRDDRVSYNKMYDDRDRRRSSKYYKDAPYEPDDIILDTRSQARDVLDELDYVIHKYGQASIATFYDIVGVTGDWTDNRYGWTDLRGASIKPVRDGFMIILPPTHVLDD